MSNKKVKKVNIVYTGQGSQYSGMLESLGRESENFPFLKNLFQEASDTLGYDVLKESLNEEKVNLTEYTQPLLVTYEYAKSFLNSMREGYRLVNYTAGHSLGEYSALLSHGAVKFSTTLRAVQRRGQLMQRAVPVGKGAMAALTCKGNADNFASDINRILSKNAPNVSVANYNAENQVVISGLKSEFDDARDSLMCSLSDHYRKVRFIPLNVSAPFHSPMMTAIEDEFEKYIKEIGLYNNSTNLKYVYSNYTASTYDNTELGFYTNLKKQISGSVRWTEIMKKMLDKLEEGDIIEEVGPKPILSGMFRTLGQEIVYHSDEGVK